MNRDLLADFFNFYDDEISLCDGFDVAMFSGDRAFSFIALSLDEAKLLMDVSENIANHIRHNDVARLVSDDLEWYLPALRDTFILNEHLLVAQYQGPELPRGAAELPEGAHIAYWLVSDEGQLPSSPESRGLRLSELATRCADSLHLTEAFRLDTPCDNTIFSFTCLTCAEAQSLVKGTRILHNHIGQEAMATVIGDRLGVDAPMVCDKTPMDGHMLLAQYRGQPLSDGAATPLETAEIEYWLITRQ